MPTALRAPVRSRFKTEAEYTEALEPHHRELDQRAALKALNSEKSSLGTRKQARYTLAACQAAEERQQLLDKHDRRPPDERLRARQFIAALVEMYGGNGNGR